jgi:hypothetical protein
MTPSTPSTPKPLAQRRRQAYAQARRQYWMRRYDRCPLTAPPPQHAAGRAGPLQWQQFFQVLRNGAGIDLEQGGELGLRAPLEPAHLQHQFQQAPPAVLGQECAQTIPPRPRRVAPADLVPGDPLAPILNAHIGVPSP